MIREHLVAPDAEALLSFLREQLREPERFLQVAGAMEVFYYGRAASTADAGDYLLLLKPDGSLQVHAARGIKPLNWQPKTDDIHLEMDDGRVVLVAERASPRELVRVVFLDTALAVSLAPRLEGGFVLQGSEAEMQRVLATDPSLIEEGLEVLDVELPVGVGGVDLYARDSAGRLVVVELKRGRATHEAVHQLERYVLRVREQTGAVVRGILAAPEVTAPARTRLVELGLEFHELLALPAPNEEPPGQPGLFDPL